MGWRRFLLFNLAGGALWAALYGGGGYLLGSAIHRIAGPVAIGLAVMTLAVVVVRAVFLHRHEAQLMGEAERAFPGPLTPPLRHGAW